MPPTEQKFPIDGFGGKNFPTFSNSLSNFPFRTPELTTADLLFSLIESKFFISIMIPLFNALPTNPVPATLAVTDVLNFLAILTVLITSSSFLAITTILGIISYALASTE